MPLSRRLQPAGAAQVLSPSARVRGRPEAPGALPEAGSAALGLGWPGSLRRAGRQAAGSALLPSPFPGCPAAAVAAAAAAAGGGSAAGAARPPPPRRWGPPPGAGDGAAAMARAAAGAGPGGGWRDAAGAAAEELSLEEVLKAYEQPVNEEQAWAVGFQCCRGLLQPDPPGAEERRRRRRGPAGRLRDTADLRLHKDGAVSARGEFGEAREWGAGAAGSGGQHRERAGLQRKAGGAAAPGSESPSGTRRRVHGKAPRWGSLLGRSRRWRSVPSARGAPRRSQGRRGPDLRDPEIPRPPDGLAPRRRFVPF
ncbi:protein spire 2 like [Crotalus adamanteus]|uniref:Protein spire 2 like n=1 Tax=Crotalus adamanteus TaxID=8729 RepID=A0AAW1ASB6_CROAD